MCMGVQRQHWTNNTKIKNNDIVDVINILNLSVQQQFLYWLIVSDAVLISVLSLIKFILRYTNYL